MTKKISLLIALVLVVAIFAFAVNAKVMPTDPRQERINKYSSLAKVKLQAPDDGASISGASAARPARLGSALGGPNSRGALVAQTWRDWLSNAGIGRTVTSIPGTPGVQFTYMAKASAVASDQYKWGWNGYSAAGGAFVVAGGKAIVQSTAPGSPEAGSYPKIMYYPANGKGIVGSYDFQDHVGSPNGSEAHVSFESVAFSGNFGNITGGSVMADTLNKSGNISGTGTTIWPAMGLSVTATDTVLYWFGFEGTSGGSGDGAVKVFRHASTAKANPDLLWQLVFKDTSFFPTCDLSCSRVSSKVAAVWTFRSAAGHISGDNNDIDVYYADSPTGLAGTWTKHDLTSYAGAGYRAWLEVQSLYTSDDNLHIIWNGGVTDGTTFGSRSCRLFHWNSAAPTTFTTIYSAQFLTANLKCWGGSNVMNVGKFSIGECSGRLYSIFSDWNDPQLNTPGDDCAKDATVDVAANGEIYLSVSKDLSGASWDKPRNLSNSYAPNCDTSANCADDRWGGLSENGIDNAVNPGTWPGVANYDPSGSYTGTSYTQVFYQTDRYPGGGILATPQGPLTLNDMRWIRLACVPPVVSAILASTPGAIDFPAYTKPAVEKDTNVFLENTGNTTLQFASITTFEDSCKGPGCVSGWLGYTGITGTSTIPEAGNTNMTLQLNKAGVISDVTAPKRAWGRLVFKYGPPSDSLTVPISLTIADSIAGVKFDTITTATTIKLVCGSNGNSGNNYAGKVNMNFPPTVECDTGGNSRGDAFIYLGDASPVILRKVGTNPARASWSIFSQSYTNPNGFKPLAHGNPPAHTNAAKWQQYFSGTFTTVDSLLKVEKTWYAPTNSVDTANFVVEKLRVWPTAAGTAVTNLAIGEAYDWDIPTDSGTSNNAGGNDATRRLVYQKGFNSLDTIVDCWNNSLRYGGSALITMTNQTFLDSCPFTSDTLYGGYTARNDSFVYPASGFVPEQLWTNMQSTGYFNQDGVNTYTDLHAVLTFRNIKSSTNGGWTIPAQAHDTFTVYSIMGVVRNAVTSAAGLDTLKSVIDKGKKWAQYWIRGCKSCCVGKRGNVNMAGITDLADLSSLVSYLTGGGFVLPCPDAANVNGAGIIDLADLSSLVSYLTGGGFVLPNCP